MPNILEFKVRVVFLAFFLLIISERFALHACLISYWDTFKHEKKNNYKKKKKKKANKHQSRLFYNVLQFQMIQDINFARFHVNFLSAVCLSVCLPPALLHSDVRICVCEICIKMYPIYACSLEEKNCLDYHLLVDVKWSWYDWRTWNYLKINSLKHPYGYIHLIKPINFQCTYLL